MGWLVSNIAGGVVRFIVASALAAVCLALGVSPEAWIASLIVNPPVWLFHPLTRVGALIVGAFLGFIAWKLWPSRAHPANNHVNFLYWDSIDPLRVIDAAHLWVEEEPPSQGDMSVSRKANPLFQALHIAADSGALPIDSEMRAIMGVTRWVKRLDLKEFARGRNERPKFLYPEDR